MNTASDRPPGAPAPALVLLPGLDGTGFLFADFAASFGPDVEVITVSYPVDRALGYGELETLARAALPRDRPFFLLGESFSGPIAIAIAANPPAGLRGLVLCCSFARNPLPFLTHARALAGFLPFKAVPAAWLGPLVLGAYSTPARRSALARAIGAVTTRALQARLKAVLAADATAALARVAVPVLYLRASRDRLVPPAAAALVRAILPGTTVVDFAAPHFLLQTRPAEAASEIRRFMERCAP